MSQDNRGMIFDIDTFAVHDGPGIRLAVYLKGCPLSCKWCHSPESQHPKRQLIFIKDRCEKCGSCVSVCPKGVHEVNDSSHTIQWEICRACGKCVDNCPHNALFIKGYKISAEAVVNKAARLKAFFDYSKGGLTLTGGEVSYQTDFAEAILSGCKALGIHTAIETCGMCSWEQLERLIAHTDLVLYDLKLIDDDEHRKWTGGSNRQVLQNVAKLASYQGSLDVRIRLPLIPDITDTEENLKGIFAFMRQVGLSTVELLPYNPSASAKYEWLGWECTIQGETQSQEQLKRLSQMVKREGLCYYQTG